MHTVDEAYAQENLVSVDPFQFNALLLALATTELSSFLNETSTQINEPFFGGLTDGRYLFVVPIYPDRRFYAPRVDYDLWVAFETLDPEASKPRLRP